MDLGASDDHPTYFYYLRGIMEKTDLAWAAGFFDGEGCVHYHVLNNKYKTTSISLSISQSVLNEDLLSKWFNIFKVGGFNSTHSHRGNENAIDHWVTARFEHIQYIMALIWPWLGKAKKDKYEEAILSWRKSKPWISKAGRPRA